MWHYQTSTEPKYMCGNTDLYVNLGPTKYHFKRVSTTHVNPKYLEQVGGESLKVQKTESGSL